jgi:transcriptional regulator with XRE-family HTH domain
MQLGDNILRIRKKKDLSQAELGKLTGTSGDVIGRYERGEMMPSIEAVTKIADALEVSIDFLVGKTNTLLDKNMMDRLQDIEQLPDDKKAYILNLIDICLRDFKTQQAYKK